LSVRNELHTSIGGADKTAMKAAGFLGIVLAAGAALYIYSAQLTQTGSAGAGSPQEQIDVTSIRTALLEIAHAERNYAAAHGTYGSFEQLRAEGAPALGTDRRGYTFQLDMNGTQTFTATATPAASSKQGWPTLSIDASMQIAER
jgi:hypothetical protein